MDTVQKTILLDQIVKDNVQFIFVSAVGTGSDAEMVRPAIDATPLCGACFLILPLN